jgi:hypothetical protein
MVRMGADEMQAGLLEPKFRPVAKKAVVPRTKKVEEEVTV